jgi:hypothetical protein
LFVRYIERRITSGRKFLSISSEERKSPPIDDIIIERIWYYFPEPRSPPIKSLR